MAYTKQSWTNGSSPLSAERMNYIESGIDKATPVADYYSTLNIYNKYIELRGAGKYGTHVFSTWTKPTDAPTDAPSTGYFTVVIHATDSIVNYTVAELYVGSTAYFGRIDGSAFVWTKVVTLNNIQSAGVSFIRSTTSAWQGNTLTFPTGTTSGNASGWLFCAHSNSGARACMYLITRYGNSARPSLIGNTGDLTAAFSWDADGMLTVTMSGTDYWIAGLMCVMSN